MENALQCELYSSYHSPNVVRVIKSRRLRGAEPIARMEEDRSSYNILTGKKILHTLYCLPNVARVIKSRRLRWADHVARMEEDRTDLKILTGKPTRRPLGGPKHRWEENIRIDLKEIGVNTRNWVDSAQDRNY